MIHVQRARAQHMREVRLALVAGDGVNQINVADEIAAPSEFTLPPEILHQDMVAALLFYAARANYKGPD